MVELRCGTKDGQYLTSLESALQQASRDFQPDLILYNAGTDILEGDPLGRSGFTYALQFVAALQTVRSTSISLRMHCSAMPQDMVFQRHSCPCIAHVEALHSSDCGMPSWACFV